MKNPMNLLVRPAGLDGWAVYEVASDGLHAEKIYTGTQVACWKEFERLCKEYWEAKR